MKRGNSILADGCPRMRSVLSRPSSLRFIRPQILPESHFFCLRQEIGALAAEGLLEERDNDWGLVGDPRGEEGKLTSGVLNDVCRIVRRFRYQTVNEVIDYVYENYPDFTVNSKRERRAPRPLGQLAIYTAGYEGKLVDGFLNMLVQNGIWRLIDVRSNPVSRRYGYHKSTLSRLCGNLDIDYQHVPELGIPPVLRHTLRTSSAREALFGRYATEMLSGQAESIERVAMMVSERPSVLVCVEADPQMCHRSRLAQRVLERIGLPIIHLEPVHD